MRTKLLVAALGVFVAFGAIAPEQSADAQGATVIRIDGGCFLTPIGGFPCTVQWTFTPSGNVNSWVNGTTGPQAATIHVDNASTGQFCSFAAPIFKGVVTKSGNVNLTCKN